MKYVPHERTSEGHVAVRFRDRYLRVFLDGKDVSNNCTEANVDEGWVLLVAGRPKSWRTPRRVYGTVRVEGEIKDIIEKKEPQE